MNIQPLWWQRGIIYQVYPRSFQDSNRDGIGDLQGIAQRLDYLQWLGIDAIWISPIFLSPMADFGYDIADYKRIDPIFGNIDDMDALIEAAHQHDIRIVLDYVPNHTSDQHSWFLESRSSRDNPKRDWYLWRDPAPDGGPPTNWISRFDGKSGWTWDETTEQYYFHSFLAEQPDVNWRNPDLREAMYDVIRFWFDRGVDGFRVDVGHRIIKDDQFRDNPPNLNWKEGMDPHKTLLETYTRNRPEVHPIFQELRQVVDAYEERMLVGEINVSLEDLMHYYGPADAPEFHLPYNFRLIYTPWNAEEVRAVADQYESLLPDYAWPNWVVGNHDQHRFASRTTPEQARVGMMLLLTLRGTPTIYYGDEIGMLDGEIPPDRVQDPWEKNVPGLGLGRDPERTPMQWDASPNAGFCAADVEPWLPVADNYINLNVAVQRGDEQSMLMLTHTLIEMRRNSAALITGDYQSLPTPTGVFAYLREADDETLIIALNFTDTPQMWTLPDGVTATVKLSTHMDREGDTCTDQVDLRANEGLILT